MSYVRLRKRAIRRDTVFPQIGTSAFYFNIEFRRNRLREHLIKGALTPKLIKDKKETKKIKDFEKKITKDRDMFKVL